MAIEITGGGKGRTATVNEDNRLLVEAEINETSHYVSERDGLVFNVNSHDATAAAGTHIVYFKNTSTTRDFYVELIRVGGVETALWKVWSVTGTAAGGNALTPTNLNLKSGVEAEATVRGDDSITGLTTDMQIANIRTAANSNGNIPFQDTLILGSNDAISVEYDTGTTGIAEVLIRGYYKTV